MFELLDKLLSSNAGLFWTGFAMVFFGMIALIASLSVSYYWLTFILITTMFLGLLMIALASMGVGE